LHVVRQRGLNPGAHETALRQATQGMRALLPESVSDWCTPHLRVGFGDRAHEILRVAREVRPDLLVIGARPGLRASSHLPWTTVAEILAGAPCPVLAVRAHYA
ncbi:MAG TPA: universal stress protein, partial [Terriglobales bacterium]|nr:universal stress protein [Terriglobales bacterium]